MRKPPSPRARLARLRAWAARGDPQALSRLIFALADPSAPVREEALRLLKRLTRKDYAFDRAAWRAWWERCAALRCGRCQTRLYGSPLYYRVQTRITSEPNELEFTEEDLRKDWAAEGRRLARELAGRDPKELEEEVFVLLDYHLCRRCKEAFVAEVRKGEARGPAS